SIHHIADIAHPVTAAWQQKIAELRLVIELKKNIQVKESKMVSQPVVAGFFKPMILLPLSMLTTLPPAETEAILLHELAHIKRKDYLVNCLQTITTIIFFFNPAVYALSTLIRNEREFCCDAITIKASGDKKVFIKALVSFAEYRNASPAVALYLNGNNAVTLKERVYRIIHGRYGKAGWSEKISCLLCLLAGIVLMSFSIVSVKNNPARAVAPANKVADALRKVGPESSSSATNGKASVGFSIGGNTEKPLKYHSTFAKAVPSDTIPANASKEFKEGFKAGQNYRDHPPSGGDEKKQLERSLSQKEHRKTNLPAKNNTQNKIQEEQLRQKRQKIG
ncbi:MAG: M56 family metallopeptidase, partial [Sediminibacterium sp.]